LVFTTANASADLVDLSAQTGITTERLQELRYIGDQVGTSQETITGSMARLIRTMGGAQQQYADYSAAQAAAAEKGEDFDGTLGDNAAAFDRLGVSITDAQGNLRDNEAVFADVITALGKINNEAERDALSMSIFGKSAQELNPLIKAGADEMERLAQEAHNVGAVMSEEDVAAFEAFDDTLASLQAGLKGTLGTLASAFLPGFQMVFDQMGGYLREFATIVKSSNGDFGAIADGISGLLGRIIGDIAAQAPQMLQAGLGILQSIINSIVQNLPTLIDAAISIITMLLDFIVQNLPTLIDAGLQILIALVQGISQALPTLIPAIVQALLIIVQTLVDNLPLIVDAALQLILALVQGLLLALPILLAAAPEIIASLVTAILEMLPLLGSAALQLIVALAYGIVANIPTLLVAVGELIVAIGRAIYDFILDTPQRGRDIIKGLADGIKSSTGMLYDAITNVINGMIAKMKSLLGMASPSKVGKGIGRNLFESVGMGGEEEAPKIRRMLTRQMLGLANDLNAVTGPQGVPGSSGDTKGGAVISVGDIIIHIPGTTATPQQIAAETKNGVISALRSKGLV
jgi:phage-related protein